MPESIDLSRFSPEELEEIARAHRERQRQEMQEQARQVSDGKEAEANLRSLTKPDRPDPVQSHRTGIPGITRPDTEPVGPSDKLNLADLNRALEHSLDRVTGSPDEDIKNLEKIMGE